MHLVDEYFEQFVHMNEYITRLERADSIPKVLEIVRAYLCSWTQERISTVQTEDQGCAPFDEFGQPSCIHTLSDVTTICHKLDERCEAIQANGDTPSRHLVELDRLFMIANAILTEMLSLSFRRREESCPLPSHRLGSSR